MLSKKIFMKMHDTIVTIFIVKKFEELKFHMYDFLKVLKDSLGETYT